MTKIHMLADTFGRSLRLRITPGQAGDTASAPDLLEGQRTKVVLADKAYDDNDLRDRIVGMNATAIIPSKRNPKVAISHNAGIYRHRNQIERCFIASNISVASLGTTTAVPFTSTVSSISPAP